LNYVKSGNAENLYTDSGIVKSRARYLDLMEKILIGSINRDPPMGSHGVSAFDESVRARGEDWPLTAYSMIGAARMRNFRVLIERSIADKTAGDIVETGVWRGGACIMARAVLQAYGITDRKVILADSFAGLPPPDVAQYPADQGSVFHEFPELAISMEDVQENFRRFDLLDEQVLMFKGWFKDTMPLIPSVQIAVLRLDGDMYESTRTPLVALFDRVPQNGWIIIDDYDCVPACKEAVHDFLKERSLTPDSKKIDGIGAFFQKTKI
jgi:O-methyltransferase